jgi:hypothetical protein
MRKVYTEADVIFQPLSTNPKFQDLTGMVFSRLTVLGFAGIRGHNSTWWCKCECGGVTKGRTDHIVAGTQISCGCFKREQLAARNAIRIERARQRKANLPTKTKRVKPLKQPVAQTKFHGETANHKPSPEYRAYTNARSRCRYKAHVSYPQYGGRGIQFRFKSFKEFLAEVGRRPTSVHSIDRIDTNGHYEVGNVRWATPQEQSNNQRSNHLIEVQGETKTLSEWARRIGVTSATIQSRLRCGWCAECAVCIPKKCAVCTHKKA